MQVEYSCSYSQITSDHTRVRGGVPGVNGEAGCAFGPAPPEEDDVFELSDEHKAIRDMARDFARNEVLPGAMARDRGHTFPHEIVGKLSELGLMGVFIPSEYGGAGMDLLSYVLALEEICYADAGVGVIMSVQHSLAASPILAFGTEAQKLKYLPQLASGSTIGCYALTEPEAGSDVASLQTVAAKAPGGFRLSGVKIYISNVGIADHYIVFANANPSEGRRGITAFLVPARTPGLTEEPLALSAEHPLGKLTFADCFVPDDAVVGTVGGGFKLALQTLDTFRVTVGAAAVGMGLRALDEAVARVSTRVQFGKALSEQPVVQSKLADMATDLDAARLLVFRAAHAKDRGGDREQLGKAAAMAKLFATEAASRAIDEAVQLHGGSGVLAGSVVEALSREVRPLRIYEGTSEIQRLIIGGAVVKERAGAAVR